MPPILNIWELPLTAVFVERNAELGLQSENGLKGTMDPYLHSRLRNVLAANALDAGAEGILSSMFAMASGIKLS